MKTGYLVCFLFGLFLSTTVSASLAIPDDLLVLTDDYSPYEFMENGTLQGVSVDLVEAAMKRIDPSFSREAIKTIPWGDGLNQTRTRNNTLIFSASRIPERETSYLWAGPLATDYKVLFGMDTAIPFDTSTLSDKRIVTISQFSEYYVALNAGAAKENMITASSPEEAIRMIENGTADLWADSQMAGERSIQTYATDPRKIQPEMILAQTELYVAANLNTSPELMQALNDSISEIRNEKNEAGLTEYEQILGKYLTVQCKPTSIDPQKVMDLVNKTAEDIKTDVTGTLEQINAGSAPYIDAENHDLYVFVYDLNTTLRADGVNTWLVGENMAGKKDIFGKAFRDEFISGALANGSGWVPYVFFSPTGSGMFSKNTYYHLAEGSDGNQYVICSGRYLTCDEYNHQDMTE